MPWPIEGSDFDSINRGIGKLDKAKNSLLDGANQAVNSAPGSQYLAQASRIPNDGAFRNNRGAVNTRQMIKWFVPERPIVTMYINPQSVGYREKKVIPKARTKGGYSLQYFGEELITLSISGTTGSSGIEGINVLRSVYRNEQIAFDTYAIESAAQVAALQEQQFEDIIFGSSSDTANIINIIDDFGDISNNSNELSNISGINNRFKPTLASLAFNVEMYWAGEVYRGYFESFDVDEKASELGLFTYNISFTVTQRRGMRQNFLAWHRSPSEPSNTSSKDNYSFGYLVEPTAPVQVPNENKTVGQSIVDLWNTVFKD